MDLPQRGRPADAGVPAGPAGRRGDHDPLADLLIAYLGLTIADQVRVSGVQVVAEAAEPHAAGRGEPAVAAAEAPARLVELSHVIIAGMVTYPGLPGPQITPHLTREASRAHYAPGVAPAWAAWMREFVPSSSPLVIRLRCQARMPSQWSSTIRTKSLTGSSRLRFAP
jgi:hypothetical protein